MKHDIKVIKSTPEVVARVTASLSAENTLTNLSPKIAAREIRGQGSSKITAAAKTLVIFLQFGPAPSNLFSRKSTMMT